MFESYYKLNANPFRLSADEHFRFAHKNYLKAWSHLNYALEQGEGFVMLTGRPGSGKTTLIRDLLSKLDRSKALAINLVTNQLQAEELLRKVALEFGLPAETYNKATLLTHIEEFVTKEYQAGRRAIIVIDEAQNLTLNGLEELRLLSNLQTGSHPLFQIFLVGQDELRTLVLSPGMEQIRQRLVATCQIESMNMQQTEGYIEHRLGIVGWDHDPEFDEVIYPLIYYLTEGIPRKINHVASRLLLYGALEGKHSFTEEDVWIVARELFDEERLSIRNGDSFTVFKERYEQATGHEGEEAENLPAAETSEFPQELEAADIDSGGIETESGAEVVTDLESESEVASKSETEAELEPELEQEEDFDTKIKDRETGSEFFPYGEELAEAETKGLTAERQRVSGESVADHKSELPGEEVTEAVGFVQLTGGEANNNDEPGTYVSTPEIIDESSAKVVGATAQPGEKKPEDILNLPSMQAERRKHEIDEKGGLINTVETIEVEELFSGVFAKSLRNIFFFVLAGLFFLALFVIKPEQIDRAFEGVASKLGALISPQTDETKVVPPVAEDKQIGTVAVDVINQQTEETKIIESPTTETDTETAEDADKTKLDSESTSIVTTTDENIIKDDTGSDQLAESDVMVDSDPVVKASKDYIATQSKYQKIEIGDAEPELETSTPQDRRFQIYFEFDNPDIPEQFKEMLNDLYIVLSLNKSSTMKITGYTDASGDPVYNMNLSIDRAKAVSRYFTERGIEAERIKVEGRGPVPKSTDDEHEALEKRFGNRRVEIILREAGG